MLDDVQLRLLIGPFIPLTPPREVMDALSEVEVMDVRTGELSDSYHHVFDVVTARAFADMKIALASGAPFLKPGGLMVLSRGPEEAIGEQESAGTGFTIQKKLELTLPHSEYKRAIWIFRKLA